MKEYVREFDILNRNIKNVRQSSEGICERIWHIEQNCVEISTTTLFKFVFQHCIGRRTGNHIIICNFFILCFVDICFNGMLVSRQSLTLPLFVHFNCRNRKHKSLSKSHPISWLYFSIWYSLPWILWQILIKIGE